LEIFHYIGTSVGIYWLEGEKFTNCTTRGVAVIYPVNIRTNPYPLPVIIEELKIDGEQTHPGTLQWLSRKEELLVIHREYEIK
jgi:hypothetical protein